MERLTLTDAPLLKPFAYESQIIERLKSYEDTGLEPGEVEALLRVNEAMNQQGGKLTAKDLCDILTARAEGRLVVLPCKVEDKVFFIENGRVCADYVMQMIAEYTSDDVFPEIKTVHGRNYRFSVNWDDVGKIVFLTRKEAEAALEAQKGGDAV